MKQIKDKDLKKLRRSDLVEIIYRLQENERSLNREITALQQKINDRRIIIDESGSIAEAALKLNSVFEAAQRAADEYLQNIKLNSRQASKSVDEADEKAKAIISDANSKRKETAEALDVQIRKILEKAKEKADSIVAEANLQAKEILEKAKADAGNQPK